MFSRYASFYVVLLRAAKCVDPCADAAKRERYLFCCGSAGYSDLRCFQRAIARSELCCCLPVKQLRHFVCKLLPVIGDPATRFGRSNRYSGCLLAYLVIAGDG